MHQLRTFAHPERWTFGGSGKRAARVTVSPRLVVNSADAAIDAATAGLGIVRVLSYQAQAGLADRSLRRILKPFEPGAMPVNLIHREDRLARSKVQSFISFAAPRLRQVLRSGGFA